MMEGVTGTGENHITRSVTYVGAIQESRENYITWSVMTVGFTGT
jgi:hypothetical protein